MTHVFYIIAALFLIMELLVLVNIKTVHSGMKRFNKLRKEKKNIKFDNLSSNMVAYQIVNFIYLIYVVVGLMSSQWLLFAALIILSFVPKRWILWRYMDKFLSIAILVFIILNKYHFHVNLTNLIF